MLNLSSRTSYWLWYIVIAWNTCFKWNRGVSRKPPLQIRQWCANYVQRNRDFDMGPKGAGGHWAVLEVDETVRIRIKKDGPKGVSYQGSPWLGNDVHCGTRLNKEFKCNPVSGPTHRVIEMSWVGFWGTIIVKQLVVVSPKDLSIFHWRLLRTALASKSPNFWIWPVGALEYIYCISVNRLACLQLFSVVLPLTSSIASVTIIKALVKSGAFAWVCRYY